MAIAAEAARSTDKGGPIIEALIDELRRRHIILPSPDTLERVGLAGRAQARRKAAEDLLALITPSQLEVVDQLLINDPALRKSPLAWLREFPESPSAASMAAITERLTYVRTIAIDPAVTEPSTSAASSSTLARERSPRPSCSAATASAAAERS